MRCRQCLPLSVVQLKGKHCRRPHCRNGVVDTFGHYICSYCNAHFSHHHKQKNVRHYHSKMSTSSEMKKSTKDIRHLETTINQSTVEKFWTRTGWNCQKIFCRLTLRLQYKPSFIISFLVQNKRLRLNIFPFIYLGKNNFLFQLRKIVWVGNCFQNNFA